MTPISPTFDGLTLGERLAILRRRAGLTQATLAVRVGCSASALSDYERGRVAMSARTARDTCLALGVSADYLLLGVAS